MKTLKELVALPWSIRGPTPKQDEFGNGWWEIRVQELPDFFVAGESQDEAIAEYGPALVAFLRSYTEAGEQPGTLPDPAEPAWQVIVPRKAPGASPVFAQPDRTSVPRTRGGLADLAILLPA